MTRFGIVLLAVAVVHTCTAADQEIKDVMTSFDKGLKGLNVSLSANVKTEIEAALTRLKTQRLQDDPKVKAAFEEVRQKLGPLKEKVCGLAGKIDTKAGNITFKVGQGLMKGFAKLGQEKFPLAADNLKAMIVNATTTAGKKEVGVKLSAQIEILKTCMKTRLTAIAKPLGLIVAKAGATNKNMFKEMVKPFVKDVDSCDGSTDDDDIDLDALT